ncbi:MAG: sulfoxide reductase heme-binding subunit YedZ [Deltaproteobacteria bacterium]|nr:sulfoxide reductase heme-binding subunit YedZ [Deltaproteobacteria bacterium]
MKLSDRLLKPPVFALCLAPLAWLVARAVLNQLGANPIEKVLNALGWWALFMLVASLAMTPLQLVMGWNWPIRIRRMVGLFAAFYASLHLLVYAGGDNAFNWHDIWADVVKRKFMTIGFAAWLLLVPLTITSTQKMMQRLKYARWKKLHRLAYVAAALGVVHFIWRVKRDETEPLRFGAVLAVLLLLRAIYAMRGKTGPKIRRPQAVPD